MASDGYHTWAVLRGGCDRAVAPIGIVSRALSTVVTISVTVASAV